MAFPRAGFSPVRKRLTVAQSRILSIRPRTRDAVSFWQFQIGSKTLMTNLVSTAATGRAPMIGKAYVSSVAVHWPACLAFFQPAACTVM